MRRYCGAPGGGGADRREGHRQGSVRRRLHQDGCLRGDDGRRTVVGRGGGQGPVALYRTPTPTCILEHSEANPRAHPWSLARASYSAGYAVPSLHSIVGKCHPKMSFCLWEHPLLILRLWPEYARDDMKLTHQARARRERVLPRWTAPSLCDLACPFHTLLTCSGLTSAPQRGSNAFAPTELQHSGNGLNDPRLHE